MRLSIGFLHSVVVVVFSLTCLSLPAISQTQRAEVLQNPPCMYPPIATYLRREACCVALFRISANGSGKVKSVVCSDLLFSVGAQICAGQIRFSPALRNGKAVDEDKDRYIQIYYELENLTGFNGSSPECAPSPGAEKIG